MPLADTSWAQTWTAKQIFTNENGISLMSIGGIAPLVQLVGTLTLQASSYGGTDYTTINSEASVSRAATFPDLAGYVAISSSPMLLTIGTYSPAVTASTNTDSAITVSTASYTRIGSNVIVSGRFTADPTLTATTTSCELSLPVASNFAAVENASGTAVCGNIVSMCAEIIAVVANDTAKVQWKSTDVTSQTWSYTYQYRII